MAAPDDTTTVVDRRLLAGLDADQLRAVTSPSALTAVIATAGSGKTRVLTSRIAHRVATGSADARHTLALTFTREAAGELRRRLHHSGIGEPVEAGTFHSVALGLLRQRWADTGRPAPAILSDPARLMREVAEGDDVALLVGEQSWAAARSIRPSAYVEASADAGRRRALAPARVAAALERYARAKRTRGVIDLDDLITDLGTELTDQRFADAVRWRFRHLHVDEAQDLNPAQFRLLTAIVGDRRDLFVVGDPAQAIYAFNGADPRFLVELDRHFPGVEIIRLETNHRSTPQIVAAGVQVLRNGGVEARVRSGRDPGVDAEFLVADDELAEAAAVARYVSRLGAPAHERGAVAVLARTHHQLTAIRQAIERAGMTVRTTALARGSVLSVALGAAAGLTSATALRAWAHDIVDVAPTATFERSAVTEPDRAVLAEQAERRVAAAALEYLREQPYGNGAGFRSWVATAQPFTEVGDDRGVELLTFHAAKGRQWNTVVVTGVETGLVPHRSAVTVDARAEECRLLHVAVTRARDTLVITRAETRRGYSRKPSPLLAGVTEVSAPPVAELSPADVRSLVALRPESPGAARHARIEALRQWRIDAARVAGVLPEQLCRTDELGAIVDADPATVDELVAVGCFGPVSAGHLFGPLRAALDAADGAPKRP